MLILAIILLWMVALGIALGEGKKRPLSDLDLFADDEECER